MTKPATQADPDRMISVEKGNLDRLSERIPVPRYDLGKHRAGIIHMSVGGFHRAHQCAYIDDVMAVAPDNWLICGVGLLDTDARIVNALNNQDGLYTLVERSADKDTGRIIGSLREMLHAPSDPASILNRFEDPHIRLLSLTVTEKGYCYDKNQKLDESHPLIQHDLKNPAAPRTAIGYAVEGLRRRKEAGLPGLTVMSCDNLPGNGHIACDILVSFARLRAPDLARWIEDNASFPSGMVDRITPVPNEVTIQVVRDKFAIQDAAPIACEDFRQWVLEDNFRHGRPAFEEAGVQIVKSVEPYEKMKVRLLNGSHSALSYISYLMGYRDVDAAMADPLIRRFVRAYMDMDVTPTLPSVPGIDLNRYKDTLIARFSNPAIRDQVLRLAEDGSQKIKNAIVPCIEHQIARNLPVRFTALALAGWFRFLTGVDEQMKEIPIKDPLADTLSARAKATPRDPAGLLGLQDIFGPAVSSSEIVRKDVYVILDKMYKNGVRKTVEDILNESRG